MQIRTKELNDASTLNSSNGQKSEPLQPCSQKHRSILIYFINNTYQESTQNHKHNQQVN